MNSDLKERSIQLSQMPSFKSSSGFIPVVLLLVFLSLAACSDSQDSPSAASNRPEGGFSTSIPTSLQSHGVEQELSAELLIDREAPLVLTIDIENNVVSGPSIGELLPGEHTLRINYYLDGILVTTLTTSAVVIAGQTTNVDASAFQINSDLDGDGVAGIDEVIFGSDPNDSASTPPVPNGLIDTPTSDQTITVGSSVRFTGSFASDNTGVTPSFLWDFGGGVANFSVEDPELVTFNSTGTFTVTFTVSDSLGLTDPTPQTRSITVNEGAAPTAKIFFPPPVSLTDALQITVRGSAADETGVNAVLVNGIAATTVDGFANWEALVPLNDGNNTVLVETRDAFGNTSTNAASASLKHQIFFLTTSGIAIDASNNRALVIDRDLDMLIAVDLTTGKLSIVSGGASLIGSGVVFVKPSDISIDAANNRALVVDNTLDALIAVDLSTGDRSIFSGGTPLIGNGVAFSTPVGIAIDTANNRALVVDRDLRELFAVNLDNGNRSTFSGGPLPVGTGPVLRDPFGIAIDVANKRALVVDTGLDALVEVNLNTGDRNILSDGSPSGDAFNIPLQVAIDTANNRALVTDLILNALVAVDLNTGDGSMLSRYNPPRSVGTGGFFVALGIVIDAGNNRALTVGGDTVDEVNLGNGNRAAFSGGPPLVGTGPSLSAPVRTVLDTVNNRVLVLNDSKLDVLIAVDLNTGERSIFSDGTPFFDFGGFSPSLRSITLDKLNNRALVVESVDERIYAVDLNTRTNSVFSNGFPRLAPGVSGIPGGIAIDSVKNRALVADSKLGLLVAVDLDTGDNSIFSSGDPSIGSGPAFSSPREIAIDSTKNRALVTDFGLNAIVAVDLDTGNRSIFSGGDPSIGSGPAFSSPGEIAIDSTKNRALVVDFRLRALVAVELDTGERSIFSGGFPTVGSGVTFVGPVGVTIDEANKRILVTDFEFGLNALVAVDLETGERVIVSR